jgi:hypothetical protein
MRSPWMLSLVVLSACSAPGVNDGGFGGGTGGSGGGSNLSRFGTFDLAEGGPELTYLAMAIDPAQERVGVAYFVRVDAFGGIKGSAECRFPDGGLYECGYTNGIHAADGGNTANYDVRYVEWKSGVTSPAQTVRTVQRINGISVAFQPNGEPAVAYLGGDSDMSAYWYQSDVALSYRSGGSTWTEQVVVRTSNQVPCGSPLDIGFLVGLYPSLVFDGNKALIAWRDGHNGAFPQQDWAGSDLKFSEGGPTAWQNRCLQSSGNVKQAYGGHINMILADGQPALVHDRAYGGSDTIGNDVLFIRREKDGGWVDGQSKLDIKNTQSGAALAWDPVEGYGIAALEHSTDRLFYTSSKDGKTWNQADPVFNAGSGGWYPSLAMDPINHEPAIAFYICSDRLGTAEFTCRADQDELSVMQRISGHWQEERVDSEGGYLPKIGFFASGKRVVAYRLPTTKVIRLAVEH